MEQKEYCKCDGCGQYHPVEDCEIVVIKMVKGRDCQINTSPRVRPPHDGPTIFNALDAKPFMESESVKPNVIEKPKSPPVSEFKEDAPGEGFHIPPKVMEEKVRARKAIIPPGIAAMMIPNGHPQFETKGAKETRYA
jgi:hypothetical protein